ncbi:MAG: hypothetical protein AAF497_28365 [Planctomycetota bacterium]
MSDANDEAIQSNLTTNIKSATGDEGQMTSHSLKDQIEAARYLRRRKWKKSGVLRSIMGPTVRPPSGRGD